MVNDQQRSDEDFFEGRFCPEKCRKIFEKRSQKLIDFIIRLVFLERIGEEVFDEG
jgi:predicted nucleic acid-binding Zn ribbon protein